jgi:hypothetical protein
MKKNFRILVTGSRTWIDEEVITRELERFRRVYMKYGVDIVIIHGKCPRGADDIADKWAKKNGIEVEPHPADWNTYGKGAGHRRNAEMVKTDPDMVLAFIRNNSPGATGCAELAEKAGLIVRRFEEGGIDFEN